MEGTIAETIPAAERPRILGREIAAAIKNRTFKFATVYGWYNDRGDVAYGCAVGAAVHVLGGPGLEDGWPYRSVEATGFMTVAEIEALEDGYEGVNYEPPHSPNARTFYRLGRKLRARTDAAPLCTG